jgi:hypothetical protein
MIDLILKQPIKKAVLITNNETIVSKEELILRDLLDRVQTNRIRMLQERLDNVRQTMGQTKRVR